MSTEPSAQNLQKEIKPASQPELPKLVEKPKEIKPNLQQEIKEKIHKSFQALEKESQYYRFSGYSKDYNLSLYFTTDSLVEHLLEKKSKISALDIGSTPHGKVPEHLMSKHSGKVTAMGITGKMSGSSLPDFVHVVDVHELDTHPTFKSTEFDFIFSNATWFHFVHPVKALENAYEKLADGGYLAISGFYIPDLFGKDLVNLLESLRKDYPIAWSPSLLFYDVVGKKNTPLFDCIFIQKTSKKPKLILPLEPEKIGEEYVHYKTTRDISDCDFLLNSQKASLDLESAIKNLSQLFLPGFKQLCDATPGLYGKNGRGMEVLAKRWGNIIDIVKNLPGFSYQDDLKSELLKKYGSLGVLFPYPKGPGEKHIDILSMSNHTEKLEELPLDDFVKFVILRASCEIEYYRAFIHFSTRCQEMGLPSPTVPADCEDFFESLKTELNYEEPTFTPAVESKLKISTPMQKGAATPSQPSLSPLSSAPQLSTATASTTVSIPTSFSDTRSSFPTAPHTTFFTSATTNSTLLAEGKVKLAESKKQDLLKETRELLSKTNPEHTEMYSVYDLQLKKWEGRARELSSQDAESLHNIYKSLKAAQESCVPESEEGTELLTSSASTDKDPKGSLGFRPLS